MKIITTLIGTLALSIAAPALAASTPVQTTFTTTGNTAYNGTYGQPLVFTPTSGSTSLRLQVTAWQANQQTNAITSAYLGAYSAGLGVTGLGDSSGNSGYHQIDNAGGYTDFLLLEFNRAVTLTSAFTNSYTLGTGTTKDNDLAFYDAGAALPTAQWNSLVTFSGLQAAPSLWTTVAGAGVDGARMLGATGASTKWLVGAAFLPATNLNDGFKLNAVTVSEVAAVPEPAAWAMMIVGFGMAGAALRRRSERTVLA